jgi:hypothetical protein
MTEHDLTNESHRESCAECTATWAELEAISAEARNLPTLTPSRDLWSGIEARIGSATPGATPGATDAPDAGPAHAKATRRWFAAPALRYAAAAAVLVAVTATVTWRVAVDRTTPTVAVAPAGTPDAAEAPAEELNPDRLVRIRAAGYEEDFT